MASQAVQEALFPLYSLFSTDACLLQHGHAKSGPYRKAGYRATTAVILAPTTVNRCIIIIIIIIIICRRNVLQNTPNCTKHVPDPLASPAMGRWGTYPLVFQLFNFSGHFRAAQTMTFDSMWLPIE